MKCLEPDCSTPEGQAALAAGGNCRGFMYWVQRPTHTDKYTLRAGIGCAPRPHRFFPSSQIQPLNPDADCAMGGFRDVFSIVVLLQA